MDCRFVTKHKVLISVDTQCLCICLSSYTVKLPIRALLHGDYLNYKQCSVAFYLVTIALFDRLFLLLTPKIWFPLLGVLITRQLSHRMHYCLSLPDHPDAKLPTEVPGAREKAIDANGSSLCPREYECDLRQN